MEYRINQQERDALYGLSHMVRLTYIEGIRPYMDYATGKVGIKRGISYQSLREELYVETQRGRTGGSPSRQQMRRAVKALERAGLVSIQSVEKRLILQCELATWDFSAQNLLGTKPPQQVGSNPPRHTDNFSLSYEINCSEAASDAFALPDIPPETGF